MTALATRTIQITNSPTFLKRTAKKDQTAGNNWIEPYGNLICALARKFTATTEEAEAAAKEIFIDIWRYAGRGDRVQTAEHHLNSAIARRRLISRLQ